MEITHIFLDMDGVLADFVAGAFRLHGRHDLAESDAPFPYELWEAMGMTAEQFYAPLGVDFWATLPLMRHADRYIENVKNSGLRWSILTAPPRDWRACVTGKHRWLEENYSHWVASKMIAYRNKDDLAGPGRLLIDDSEKNCELWRQAGGVALCPSRRWNDCSMTDEEIIECVAAWGK